MIYSCTDDETYSSMCTFVDRCVQLLDTYHFLSDSFILEFFVEDQWNRLPVRWQASLGSSMSTVEDVHDILQNKQSKREVLPLSLICFLRCTEIYKFQANNCGEHFYEEIRRLNHLTNDQQTTGVLPTKNEASTRMTGSIIKQLKIGDKETSSTEPESALSLMNKQLNKHLTPKKAHEIDKLSTAIHQIADRNCKFFDIGSGQGHLSRRLAFQYKFSDIISVDCNSKFLMKASQFDEQLINDHKCSNVSKPKQLNHRMNKENVHQLSSSQCDWLLKKKENFGLIGLHTCGNLSHELLDLYKSNQESKYLFLCSCCYHKTEANRYLISEHLKRSKTMMTVETRANACHSIDKFLNSLKSKPEELKVHTYRALLEYLLDRKSPKNRKRTLNKVHCLSSKTFAQYVDCAIKDVNIIDELDLKSDEMRSLIESKLSDNLKVIAFYALRTLLGPLTESILLADRMLFLYEEKKIKSKLVSLFDAKLSPRNFLLVSTK